MDPSQRVAATTCGGSYGPKPANWIVADPNEHNAPQVSLVDDQGHWIKQKDDMEMIVTKDGRRLFPRFKCQIKGLNPTDQYKVYVALEAADGHRYKYDFRSTWTTVGLADPPASNQEQLYCHPDSPCTGDAWSRQNTICFDKLKITNKEGDTKHIHLNTMQKYRVKVYVVRVSPTLEEVSWSYVFARTTFIAVTTYNNEAMRKFKVQNNAFAKGHRQKGALGDDFPHSADPLPPAVMPSAQIMTIAASPFSYASTYGTAAEGAAAMPALHHQPQMMASSSSSCHIMPMCTRAPVAAAAASSPTTMAVPVPNGYVPVPTRRLRPFTSVDSAGNEVTYSPPPAKRPCSHSTQASRTYSKMTATSGIGSDYTDGAGGDYNVFVLPPAQGQQRSSSGGAFTNTGAHAAQARDACEASDEGMPPSESDESSVFAAATTSPHAHRGATTANTTEVTRSETAIRIVVPPSAGTQLSPPFQPHYQPQVVYRALPTMQAMQPMAPTTTTPTTLQAVPQQQPYWRLVPANVPMQSPMQPSMQMLPAPQTMQPSMQMLPAPQTMQPSMQMLPAPQPMQPMQMVPATAEPQPIQMLSAPQSMQVMPASQCAQSVQMAPTSQSLQMVPMNYVLVRNPQ